MSLLRILCRTALILVCVSLHGQTGSVPRPPAVPEYVLQPGELASLHVIDVDEISDKPIRLDSAGYVDIPLAVADF